MGTLVRGSLGLLVEEVLAHLVGKAWGELSHPAIQVVHHHLGHR